MPIMNWRNSSPLAHARRVVAAIAWTAFFAALWFALDFNVLARQRLGQIEGSRVTLDRQSLQSKQVEALRSLVVGAASASDSATRFYRDHLATLDESDQVPADLLESGATLVSEARLRIATAEGAIAGVFANDPLANDAVALRSRLQRISSSMGILGSFFGDYSAVGHALAIRKLRAADTWIRADSVDTQSSRLRVWDENAIATAKVSSAESEHQASWRRF
jgi:hypothetical protein